MISINDRKFLTEALKVGKRLDGRSMEEQRPMEVTFGSQFGHVELTMGKTKVVVRISAEITKPNERRPFEGIFVVHTDIGSMASPIFENNHQSEQEIMISQVVEKAVRRSGALDLESLCIVAGKKCWEIRADVHYLDFDGGLVDATCAAVMAGLYHFKKPDVDVDGGAVTVCDMEERHPVALSVLHLPVSVTYGLFELKNDETNEVEKVECVLDCTAIERQVQNAEITITINKNRDICQISKPSGVSIEGYRIVELCEKAFQEALKVTEMIDKALKEDEEMRNKGNWKALLSAENDRYEK
ncbi:ribosomal protein S5 domain 2-type protein [Yarrowia lipolytica]|jgi:exosome complex component RRP45|uniref:Exosome complex component RRP45 n=1 Tax=Yarrowia lipolytica TaxID=4952 RepID=A0A371CDU3_YARLL|nr:Exosome complex component RRP45 [Yarrowia lipolytica]RDW28456.1 ribosomal protein S5 domain 2-type protein [Yarrowia lipolytica]RDW31021.1 ribosomal protein S5 domain 2-type protein [Yarrowia lipolytica]RDW40257.1 ribosomal protein S5 domain 2-type protein [Yarrowia lipolytica]RDW45090.1 ribosomal protein S5 domain 2-type protein [Yarrowia lipolytica]